MNEVLQWICIVVVFWTACWARGSAVRYSYALLMTYDKKLGKAFRGEK
jgi:hypothetical protein